MMYVERLGEEAGCDVVRGAAGDVVDVKVVVVIRGFIALIVQLPTKPIVVISNHFLLNFIRSCSQCMSTRTAEKHLLTTCLLAIMLLIKKLFKNNTNTFPTGSGRRIKNALLIRTPHGHTCLWDFAESLHANANDINVARMNKKTHVIMQNIACKGAYPKAVQQKCPTVMK